jgi:DNA-binding MarR family transcriptional regulator
MERRIRSEIHQSKPFASVEEEVYIQLLLTTRAASRAVVEALKPHGLTPSQYNVLRILRGARPGGLACGAISERMVNHDPDLTRLLDRMQAAGWVVKERDAADRRVVTARVTPAGVDRVAKAAPSVNGAITAAMGGIAPRKLEQLADLLQHVRDHVKSRNTAQG